MKIIIIPDSFKGTLTSSEVCQIIEKALALHNVTCIPVADGGEGTLEAFSNAKAAHPFAQVQTIMVPVKDALEKDISAPYLLLGNTAVIEMAKVAGFVQKKSAGYGQHNNLVMRASTYGVGMLVQDAIKRGAKKIIVGLGGSCSNDGGCGMAAALGTVFYNHSGEAFVPTGGTLSEISRIDNSKVPQIEIVGMCDVENPLCGQTGAAYVFGPQKGASPEDIVVLDRGLEHLVSVLSDSGIYDSQTAEKLSLLFGSGAAGGLGFGIRALLGGHLERGIDMLLDTIGFDSLLSDADYVITGEGRFDSQSLRGKAVSGICQRAKAAHVPVILVAGSAKAEEKDLENLGIIKCFETGPLDFSQSAEDIKKAALSNLEKAAREIADFL